ncbi:ribonuclease HII [Candidatus Saccharibacteria bacterium]|nr:ribonuclease HII [Candidatus Saccharibacteria bacterium]
MLTLGIDEVGRGAWAGPMAVGAVILNSSIARNDPAKEGVVLTDSKKLSKKQREIAARWVHQSALAIGIGWVSASEIDRFGLSEALKKAAQRAIRQIPAEIFDRIDQIIIDGRVKLIDDPRATTLVRADSKVAAVSAAAIVAKVFRDSYMTRLDAVFDDYHFAQHVGYGTILHQEKLQKFGPIDGIHRQSFAPIAQLGLAGDAPRGSAQKCFSKKKFLGADGAAGPAGIENTSGRIAENVAADYLQSHGHQIIAQNWKTKFCEIDIISEHRKILYFTEVKYRENIRHGDGLSAITPKKLKSMRFAAEFYLNQNADLIKNYEIRLSAIALSDNPPSVDEHIDILA